MADLNKDKPLDGNNPGAGHDPAEGGGSVVDGVTNHNEGGDDDDDLGPADKIDPKKFESILEDRKAKGKQNQALKKQLAEQAAALAKFQADEDARKKASLSELEKAKLEKEELEKKFIARELVIANLQRKNLVINAHVPDQYQDAVSLMLENAQKTEKDLDVPKWFKDLQVKSPALFDLNIEQPHPTAGGPQSQNNSTSKRNAELDKRIADAIRVGDRQKAFLLNQEKMQGD